MKSGSGLGDGLRVARDHNAPDHDRARQRQYGCNKDMSECARHDGFEDCRIENEHGSRDCREADGKQHEQFGARQLREIGADQQRRFDHAEKNRGRRAKPDRAADAHRLAQAPRKTIDENRQDFPIPQQGRQRRDHDHQRQNLKREAGHAGRIIDRKRRGRAADISKHEGCPGLGRGSKRIDDTVQREQNVSRERDFEEQQRKCDLQREPDDDGSDGKGAAVLREHPRRGEDNDDPKSRLQMEQEHQ